jgi:hypothetical protein
MALSRAAGLGSLAQLARRVATRLMSSEASTALPADGSAPSTQPRADPAPRHDRSLRPPAAPRAASPPKQQPAASPKAAAKKAYPERLRLRNEMLTKCDSAEAVLKLAGRRAALCGVNAATAMMMLLKHSAPGEAAAWAKDARFQRVLRAAGKAMRLRLMEARGMTNALWVCAEMRVQPPWLDQYWRASLARLPQHTPLDLSLSLFALGQLRAVPPEPWLERFWALSGAKLSDFAWQGHSNMLHALASLQVVPPAPWLAAFWRASTPKLPRFAAPRLADAAAALATLKLTPPEAWRSAFWAAAAPKLEDVQLPDLLPPCAPAGIRPPDALHHALSRRLEAALQAMTQRQAADVAGALAALRLWGLAAWPPLWERLCGALARDDFDAWGEADVRDAGVVLQVLAAAEAERPGMLTQPPAELLDAARRAVGQSDTAVSRGADKSGVM